MSTTLRRTRDTVVLLFASDVVSSFFTGISSTDLPVVKLNVKPIMIIRTAVVMYVNRRCT